MSQFSDVLKQALVLSGLDQAAFANAVGRKQQTISDWLKGKYLPRGDSLHKVLAVFPKDVALKLERTARGVSSIRQLASDRQDIPLIDLSLGHLGWLEFQSFCVTYFKYKYGDQVEVHEYGVGGDAQAGIDIRIVFPDGKVHTVQCKHEKTFGPADVEGAIRKQTLHAGKKYLIATRPLTRAARDAAIRYEKEGWVTWGIDDLTREIRLLDGDKSELLLRQYAAGQIEQVLGVRKLTPFYTVEDYFGPRLDSKIPGHHGLELVGRTTELDAIANALANEKISSIAIVGRGGEGKSKLLYESLIKATETAPKLTIRILDKTSRIDSALDLTRYKHTAPVFVIEDAHERGDLAQILTEMKRAIPDARVAVVTRPYTLQMVKRNLFQAGFGFPREVCLSSLSYEQLCELAERTFNAHELSSLSWSRLIAKYTKGSPLFTVVAATLSATRKVHPARFEGAELDSVVFGTYIDSLVGNVGGSEGRAVRDVAELISLTQPIDCNTDVFLNLCHHYAGLSHKEVAGAITYLIDRSLLTRHGKAMRLAPDMLADYILERTCIEADGTYKRALEKLLGQLDGELIGNVLANIARLDWKRGENGSGLHLISMGIWPLVKAQFQKGRSREILEALQRTSFYLPQQAMAFCDELDWDDDDVKRALPTIFHNAAYNYPDGTIEAVKRLWRLGRSMPGELHQLPQHPIRILHQLFSPTGERSAECLAALYEFGKRLLADPSECAHLRHPLEFLEALFVVEGHSDEFVGYNWIMRYETIDYSSVAKIRRDFVDVLLSRVTDTSLKEAVRAIATVEQASRFGHGLLGGKPSEDLDASLEAEFVETFGKLTKLVQEAPLNDVVLVAIAKCVDWHAVYCERKTKGPAANVLDAISSRLKSRIALQLIDPWGHIALSSEKSSRERLEIADGERIAVIEGELASLDAADIVQKVSEALRDVTSTSPPLSAAPYEFIYALCERRSDVAACATAEILANPDSPWRPYAQFPVAALGRSQPARAVEAVKCLVATGDESLVHAAAIAVGSYQPNGKEFSAAEIELLTKFAASENPNVSRSAVGAARKIAVYSPQTAKRLLLAVNLRSGKGVLHEWGSILTGSKEIQSGFSEQDWLDVLSYLKTSPTIDDWEIVELLGKLSEKHPQAVYEFLVERIEVFALLPYDDQLEAVPHFELRGSHLQIKASPLLGPILNDILIRVGKWRSSWRHYHDFVELFFAISGGIGDAAKAALENYLLAHGKDGAEVLALILRKNGANVAINEPSFSKRVLALCVPLGEDAVKSVSDALYISSTTGTRSGTAGQAFPEDVRLRDGAQEILESLSVADPAWRLYRQLHDHAEASIKSERTSVDRW